MSTTTPYFTAASQAPVVQPTPKRWTREEYHRLGEQGWFQDQRVELINGEIIVLSPQSPQHVNGAERVRRVLAKAFEPEYCVRPHAPVTHGDYSEPEPDVCVVRGVLDDFDAQHPTTAALIVEVSRTSLLYDRTIKQRLYASMGVPDYWVLDLDNRQLIVHRTPVSDSGEPFAHSYRHVAVIGDGGSVAPLEKPGLTILVADMLPPAGGAKK